MQLASISPWRDRGRGRDETGGAPVEARQAISLVWLPPSTGENNEAIPATSPMSQRSVVQIDPRHPRNHRRRSKRLCFPGERGGGGILSRPGALSGPQIVVSAPGIYRQLSRRLRFGQ